LAERREQGVQELWIGGESIENVRWQTFCLASNWQAGVVAFLAYKRSGLRVSCGTVPLLAAQ
jgi:hypothetical protein